VTGQANRFARVEVSTVAGPGGEPLRVTRDLDSGEESIVHAGTGEPWVPPVNDDGVTGRPPGSIGSASGDWWARAPIDLSQL
jgi:hypothetical protein